MRERKEGWEEEGREGEEWERRSLIINHVSTPAINQNFIVTRL